MGYFAKVWKRFSFVFLIAFLVGGLFDFRIALFAVVCMIAPVAVSIFRGRFWCGNVCPRGSFFDTLVAKIERGKTPPAFVRSYAFRLAVIACMFTVMGFGVYRSEGSLLEIGQVVYRLIFVTTVVGVVLSLFYNRRTWCAFCPMGTLASFVSRFSARTGKRLLSVSSSCVSCSLCQKKCPVGIVPHAYKGDHLADPDCIQCGICAATCPKKAIGY